MKNTCTILAIAVAFLLPANSYAQNTASNSAGNTSTAKAKADIDTKAAGYVAALNLTDAAKAARVKAVIATHLTTVRDWHNSHPYTLTPEGINPITGKVFTKLERQLIIDSTIPKTAHDSLMNGLRKDLDESQVEIILDKYTIGKVAFTMNGYKSIVPDMTPAEGAVILTNLKLAREQSVDYKDIKEISTIFKIYKTKIEDYLNSNGRNWKQMYQAYFDKMKAKKASGATSGPAKN